MSFVLVCFAGGNKQRAKFAFFFSGDTRRFLGGGIISSESVSLYSGIKL